MADELAAVYVSIIPSAKGMAASLGKELGAPVAAASASASRTMQSTFAAGGAKIAKGLKYALVSGIAAGGLVTAGLLKVGSDFQNAFKTIRVGSGQTGTALQGLEKDFKTVLQQRPDNMQAVAKAVTDLNVRLGLTGPRLQEAAKQQLRLASITKTDVGDNIKVTSQLFTQYGIKASQQGKKLDELFRASQKTGVSVAELAKGMISAGPVTRQLGLSYEESAGFLGVLAKAGIDSGQVIPALSKTIATAAKNGKNAGDVFRSTFDAIRKAPTDTAAAAAAIDTFGARAGPRLAGLIREGKISYGELVGQIANGKDTIAKAAKDTATFSGKWKVFKNSVLVAIQPIATKFFNGLGNAMAWLAPRLILLVGILQAKLPPAFDRIKVKVAPLVEWFQARLPAAIDRVRSGFLRFVSIARTVVTALANFTKHNPRAVLAGLGAVLLAFVVPAFYAWASAAIASAAATVVALAPAIALAAGIALLAGGVVYAYQHFTVFRNVVDSVGRFLVQKVWPALQAFAAGAVVAFKGIAVGAQWLWRNVLQPAFVGIKAYITGYVVPAFKFWWTVAQIAVAGIGVYISTLWNTVIHPIFTAVSAYIRGYVVPAFNFWKGVAAIVFPLIAGYIRTWWAVASAVFGFVAPIVGRVVRTFISMKDKIISAFHLVQAGIATAKDKITTIALGIVGVIGGIKDGIGRVLGGIADVITAPFRGAIGAIKRLWNSTLGGFSIHIPDIPGLPGRGQSFGFPKLHTGGIVPGRRGQEVPILAIAGETVLPTHRSPASSNGLQPGARSAAPLVGTANFYDGVDMDLFFHKVGFELAKGGL